MLLKWRARYQAARQSHGQMHPGTSDPEAAKAEIRRLQR
jgi:hypothetical protein